MKTAILIAPDSHCDHGVTAEQLKWALDEAWRESFPVDYSTGPRVLIVTVDLPEALGTVPCGLHGPVMGDAPVLDAEVHYAKRGDRKGMSRLCRRNPRQVRQVTVIAGPHGDEPCVLYTAFGGPPAEREPWELDHGRDQPAVERSVAFWREHALSVPGGES